MAPKAVTKRPRAMAITADMQAFKAFQTIRQVIIAGPCLSTPRLRSIFHLTAVQLPLSFTRREHSRGCTVSGPRRPLTLRLMSCPRRSNLLLAWKVQKYIWQISLTMWFLFPIVIGQFWDTDHHHCNWVLRVLIYSELWLNALKWTCYWEMIGNLDCAKNSRNSWVILQKQEMSLESKKG